MRLTVIAFLFLLFSCNQSDKTDNTTNMEKTTTASPDIEAQKKELNDRSKACIAIMNAAEQDMNAASAAGNAEAAATFKARIDSAARENVKIGQQLMELEK